MDFGWNLSCIKRFGSASYVADWATFDATKDKSPVTFTAAQMLNPGIVAIDSSRFIMTYKGTSSHCKAIIGTIDAAGTVTFGAEATIYVGTITDAAISLLDSTHAIIATTVSSNVYTVAIEFSGNTISTVGTPVSVAASGTATSLAIAGLTSDSFFVAFEASTSSTVLYYGGVSGTTVTMGSSVSLTTQNLNTLGLAISAISSTQAIVAVANPGINDLQAHLVSFSGTAPGIDNTLTILNGSFTITRLAMAKISSTKVILCYGDTNVPNSRAVIVSESSGTLSAGTPATIGTDSPEFLAVALPEEGYAVASVGVNNASIKTSVLAISGTTVTPGTQYEIVTGDKEAVASCAVGQPWVVVMYGDDNDSGYGKVIVVSA